MKNFMINIPFYHTMTTFDALDDSNEYQQHRIQYTILDIVYFEFMLLSFQLEC